ARRGGRGRWLPEAGGGGGLGRVEPAILLDEMGRAAYPGPYLPTTLAAHLITTAGAKEQKGRWLPAIATGGARAAAALVDADLSWDPPTTGTRAEKAGNGWRRTGGKQFFAGAPPDVALSGSARPT